MSSNRPPNVNWNLSPRVRNQLVPGKATKDGVPDEVSDRDYVDYVRQFRQSELVTLIAAAAPTVSFNQADHAKNTRLTPWGLAEVARVSLAFGSERNRLSPTPRFLTSSPGGPLPPVSITPVSASGARSSAATTADYSRPTSDVSSLSSQTHRYIRRLPTAPRGRGRSRSTGSWFFPTSSYWSKPRRLGPTKHYGPAPHRSRCSKPSTKPMNSSAPHST